MKENAYVLPHTSRGRGRISALPDADSVSGARMARLNIHARCFVDQRVTGNRHGY